MLNIHLYLLIQNSEEEEKKKSYMEQRHKDDHVLKP